MGWPFRRRKEMPGDMWQVCPECNKYILQKQVEEALFCCPECAHHFAVSGRQRIEITADPGTIEEVAQDVRSKDVLGFVDGKAAYAKKLVQYRKKTGQSDACVVARARVHGIRTVIAALDFKFMGGSMGHAVGEKLAIALELALDEGLPCVVFSASGGARMQEGVLSLMQMSKTSAAVQRFKERGHAPFISVLTDPTTGGVTASYAALGDIILAEPKALIGFAGPRVIKETIRQDLPEGFQRAEFLKDQGFVDRVVPRAELRDTLCKLFTFLLPASV